MLAFGRTQIYIVEVEVEGWDPSSRNLGPKPTNQQTDQQRKNTKKYYVKTDSRTPATPGGQPNKPTRQNRHNHETQHVWDSLPKLWSYNPTYLFTLTTSDSFELLDYSTKARASTRA